MNRKSVRRPNYAPLRALYLYLLLRACFMISLRIITATIILRARMEICLPSPLHYTLPSVRRLWTKGKEKSNGKRKKSVAVANPALTRSENRTQLFIFTLDFDVKKNKISFCCKVFYKDKNYTDVLFKAAFMISVANRWWLFNFQGNFSFRPNKQLRMSNFIQPKMSFSLLFPRTSWRTEFHAYGKGVKHDGKDAYYDVTQNGTYGKERKGMEKTAV